MKENCGEFTEYHEFIKDELEAEDWNEFANYAALVSKFCGEGYDIEERPEPSVDKIEQAEKIEFKSYVGLYRFKTGNSLVIKHDKDKLSERDFNTITRDVAEWGAMLGAPFLKALLEILSPITRENEILLAYSDLLKRYTETALTEYVPPTIERRRYVAEAPLGRIIIPQTLSLLAQGQTRLVSERAKARIVSLPLLFMIRFHSDVTRMLRLLDARMKQICLTTSIQPSRAVSESINYHTSFLTETSREKLFETAYNTDFLQIEVLDKVKKQASTASSILDMVSLWEAFIGNRALASLVTEILRVGYGLKPLCKLYELWCLKTVLDVLSEMFGEYVAPKELPGRFVFPRKLNGVRAEVFYNVWPRKSMLVRGLREKGLGVSAGKRPDFTITFSGPAGRSMTLVSDAKYRLPQNIGDEDLARLFWYMLDYGEFTEENKLEGLFFHVSTKHEIHECVSRRRPEINIHLLTMKPTNIVVSKPKLGRLFHFLLASLQSNRVVSS